MKANEKNTNSPTSVKLGKRKAVIDKIAKADETTIHNVIITAIDMYIGARNIKTK